jgi:hypothetical protein
VTHDRRPRVWRPDPSDDDEPPARAAEAAAWKRKVYSEFDLSSFERRREKFWKSVFSDPSFDLDKEVDHVLRARPDGPLLFPFSWDEIPVGTELWRAREMDAEAINSGITEADLWEPPASVASAGRFNEANEPLLYTCIGLPIQTLTEARVLDPNASFILIGYQIVEPLRAKRVGVTQDTTLTARQQRIERKISEFLAQVVSIPAESMGSSTYRHTQRLLRDFYRLEEGWESGWTYWSTLADPDAVDLTLEPLNLAIEPADAHSKLEVRYVVTGTQQEYKDGLHHIALHGYATGETNAEGLVEFKRFPHEEFSSLQDYFDYLDVDWEDPSVVAQPLV